MECSKRGCNTKVNKFIVIFRRIFGKEAANTRTPEQETPGTSGLQTNNFVYDDLLKVTKSTLKSRNSNESHRSTRVHLATSGKTFATILYN